MSMSHHDLAHAMSGGTPKRQADGSYKINCPVHDDPCASLQISKGDTQPYIMHCHAGCSQDALMAKARMFDTPDHAPVATGVVKVKTSADRDRERTGRFTINTRPDGAPESFKHREFGEPTKIYEYRHADGAISFYNCRFEFQPGTPAYENHGRKTMRPLSCNTSGKWVWAAPAKGERIPYGLDTIQPGTAILIHEGEKARDAAAELMPECSHISLWGGASGAEYADVSMLAGHTLHVIPDVDRVSDEHPHGASVTGFSKLAARLRDIGCTVETFFNVHEALEAVAPDAMSINGFDAADALELSWPHDKYIDFLTRAKHHWEPEAPAMADDSAPAVPVAYEPFVCLGYSSANGTTHYYYRSVLSHNIVTLTPSKHDKRNLMQLQPSLGWWESKYPAKQGVAWDNATSHLMAQCHAAGYFNADNMRGRGAWVDGSRVVLNCGDRLLIDGESFSIIHNDCRAVYEYEGAMIGDLPEPATDAEAALVLETATKFAWERPINGQYLAGWVALAPVSGALNWRPHIWLTGAKGHGKTTVLERFVCRLLDGVVAYFKGDTTEAGIRQTIKRASLPIVIDEAESDNERNRLRIRSIVEMARLASSESESRVVKGSATGAAVSYHVRSMFCFASIGIGELRSADQSRIARLVLRKNNNSWRSFSEQLNVITPELGGRLFARTLGMVPTIRNNAKVLSDAVVRLTGSEQRYGDQVGALLAGSVSLQTSQALTPADAEAVVTPYIDDLMQQADDVADDHALCFNHLMEQLIMTDKPGARLSVCELILAARGEGDGKLSPADAQSILKRHGVRCDPNTKACTVIRVAKRHTELSRMYRDTPWVSSWSQYLERIPGAVKAPKTRFSGTPADAVEVPISYFAEFVEDDSEGLF